LKTKFTVLAALMLMLGTQTARMRLLFSIVGFLVCSAALAQTLDINGYTTAVVPSLQGDTFGLVGALREAAASAKLKVVARPELIGPEDQGKTMVLTVAWQTTTAMGGGKMTIDAIDLATGRQIATSSHTLLSTGLVKRATNGAVSGLKYKGYDERAHQANLKAQNLLSSENDQFAMTEADLVRYLDENRRALDPLEGIWAIETQSTSFYKIGIVRTPGSTTRAFTAFILESNLPWWRPGDIKARFEGTARQSVYTSAYLTEERSLARLPFEIKEEALLVPLSGTPTFSFVKNYPDAGRTPTTTNTTPGPFASGTGFVIGKNVVVTNHHVIDSGTRLEFATESSGTFPLEIVSDDKANDLAILRVMPSADGKYPSFRALPIASAPARLGEDVYAIGYPLTDILGGAIRVTNGSISALQGIDADPRYYQVSIPIQPGNSGGPVLNGHGEVVGIITAELNALGVARATGSVPQNVNFAAKIDYVVPLIPVERRSTPDGSLSVTQWAARADQVEVLKKSVGQVRVYR
jgi:S1-C subfamily serine protease